MPAGGRKRGGGGRATCSTISKRATARPESPRICRAARRLTSTRALANRPRIVLADKPAAALDSKRAGLKMDLPRRLATEQENAIVTVTHDEKIFDRFDRLIHLRDGRPAAA